MRKSKQSRQSRRLLHASLALCCAMISAAAAAKLPQPTQEQEQAAAAKKAQAEAQAEKDKQSLAASMDAVTARWRARAAANGWPTHPATAVAAAQGLSAPATQSGPSGQPGGKLGSAAAEAPVRSEKAGTAPPSADIKQKQEK